ncbi:MAG: carbohydrate ABC transporter permease [Spirochaetaceae bacterium]|nr:MAG: carbohydrate ABC transporter permease [Spirochaetaceae bacterium]
MHNYQLRKRIVVWVVFCMVLILTVVWLTPILVALLTSLRSYDDIMLRGFFAVPEELSFDSYLRAWRQGRMRQYLPNSFMITLPALGATLLLSSLSAYAISRFRFPGRRPIYYMFIFGMMLPLQILMIPVFGLSNSVGLYDTYIGLIAIHTAFFLGFNTFVLKNYMSTVPPQIFDSAHIDGCSELRIWWQIMLPLTLPAFAALATLLFTWIFNDYLWALILIRTGAKMPVTTGLASLQGEFVTDWTVIMAGSLIATVPTLTVFIFLQRYFIEGLTMGSNK